MYEYTPADKTIFDPAFDASRSPEVRAVRHMTDAGERLNAAMALAQKGAIMIEAIDVEAMDPYTVMYLWTYVSKWPWQPSLLQPKVLLGPGETYPGLPDFDPTPPPGAVIVKCNMDTLATDYPPFDPPPPPAPTPSTNIVGPEIGSGTGIFREGAGARKDSQTLNVVNGEPVDQNGVTYITHAFFTPMGWTMWFTKA